MAQRSISHRYARAMSDEVLQRLELVDAVPHRGESGRARENCFRDFLRKLIPPDIGIDTGFIIDGAGGVSRQVDIVIYRTDYYPIFEIGGVKHFIVESVLAVFEVKATLDSRNTVLEALTNLESVKTLDRTGGGTNYDLSVMPLLRLINQDDFDSQIFAGIITERTLSPKTLIATIAEFIDRQPRMLWPNIYVAAKNYTLCYATPDGTPTADPTVADRIALSDPARDNSEPPLVDLARELADVLRVSARIDFHPNSYFPLPESGELLELKLPDDAFPGRRELSRLGDHQGYDQSRRTDR